MTHTYIEEGNSVFKIPAINNQKEALAIYLGVNSEIDLELDTIKEVSTTSPVHIYKYKEVLYSVAHNSYGLKADKLVQFNSSLWAICEQKAKREGG